MFVVTHWCNQKGSEPCWLKPDKVYYRLIDVYIASPADAAFAICKLTDGQVFAFDMRFGSVGVSRVLRCRQIELDVTDVNWYKTTDEAIVRSVMQLNQF